MIFTVIMFMFVMLVSIAMLSMAVGNLNARVAESRRIENLYASDSGMDMAYNICGKTIASGINYAYYEVNQLKEGNNLSRNQRTYNLLVEDVKKLNDKITDLQNTIDAEKKKDEENKSKDKM